MARMYNIREGFADFTEGPLEGKGTLNKKDFEEVKRLRYELMG